MSPLPTVPPDVVADLVEALPSRLRKRLDEVVAQARSWPVVSTADGYAVAVDEQTTVHLAATVTGVDDVRCSCLLAPRCLHRAAVVSLTDIADTDSARDAGSDDPGAAGQTGQVQGDVATARPDQLATPAGPTEQSNQVPEAGPDQAGAHGVGVLSGQAAPARAADAIGPAERDAATALWEAAAAILATGVSGAGAVSQATLLRAAHEARAQRLPRAASAAVRTVERLRAIHREDPAFRLADLVADLHEVLLVSHALRCGVPLRGTPRRDFHLVGNERLYGLCCEPIVTASGYAGAVTHLVDRVGRLWQAATVMPGGAALAVLKADTPVSVGEARLTHRELGRGGLFTTDLRASADGRISTGHTVRAVGAAGATWADPPLDDLWRRPLRDQLARHHAALDLAPAERPAGHDLLFVEGHIAGMVRDGVLVATDGPMLTAAASNDAPDLSYVDNLRVLGTSIGLPVRLVGRPAGRGRIAVIAVGGEGFAGRHIDLGLDRLRQADVPPPAASRHQADGAPPTPSRHQTDGAPPTPSQHQTDAAPLTPSQHQTLPAAATPPNPSQHPTIRAAGAPPAPPLHLLRRRIERAVEGGRTAAPGDPRDAERLRAAALLSAAELTERLDAACRIGRDAFGRAVAPSHDSLADAWLAAAVYLVAADRSAELEAWAPAQTTP
jgi:hypothetical protein